MQLLPSSLGARSPHINPNLQGSRTPPTRRPHSSISTASGPSRRPPPPPCTANRKAPPAKGHRLCSSALHSYTASATRLAAEHAAQPLAFRTASCHARACSPSTSPRPSPVHTHIPCPRALKVGRETVPPGGIELRRSKLSQTCSVRLVPALYPQTRVQKPVIVCAISFAKKFTQTCRSAVCLQI